MSAAATTETPEQRVARLNAELRGKSAQEIIRAASREFGRKITYVSSFGAESAAMLGLIAEVDPGMPIVFIDTGMHFHQTLQYRDAVRDFLKLGRIDVADRLDRHARQATVADDVLLADAETDHPDVHGADFRHGDASHRPRRPFGSQGFHTD